MILNSSSGADKMRDTLWLNLPGLVHGWYPARTVFVQMAGTVYFQADAA